MIVCQSSSEGLSVIVSRSNEARLNLSAAQKRLIKSHLILIEMKIRMIMLIPINDIKNVRNYIGEFKSWCSSKTIIPTKLELNWAIKIMIAISSTPLILLSFCNIKTDWSIKIKTPNNQNFQSKKCDIAFMLSETKPNESPGIRGFISLRVLSHQM